MLTTTSAQTTILSSVLELLKDGRARSGAEIARELEEKINRSFDSILTTLSGRIAHDRRILRSRVRGRFVYSLAPRRVDVAEEPFAGSR